MRTQAQAIAADLTIDSHAAGRPFAYRGDRFKPDHIEPVLTDLEAELVAALPGLLTLAEWDHRGEALEDESPAEFDAARAAHAKATAP